MRLAAPERGHELAARPSWKSFVTRHGLWSAAWNEATASPHRAIGPSIALPGAGREPAAVDRAVRAFVADHAEVFGRGTTLETAAVFEVRGLWHARYRQTFRGVPVAFADWEFRVRDGRLVAFGADAHAIPADTRTRPLLAAAVAREAARAGIEFDPLADRLEGGEQLWLVPDADRYRLACEVRVIAASPPAHWIVLVDAENGEVLWRHDRVRTAVSGTVTGDVHLTLPTDPATTVPFASQSVSVDGGIVVTDLSGFYSGPASGSAKVITALSGPYCLVDRTGGQDAGFTQTVQDPATVNVGWTAANSLDSERDGFHHVNVAHDWVKALDPGFTGNDYAMPCRVEIGSDVCNAYWDGAGVNFYAAGGGCPSMATLPDVVYHEYGHAVNDHVYVQAGVGFGMLNGALHEGMADVLAAFLQDDPEVGNGFFGPGSVLRDVDNIRAWPADRSGDGHVTGLIVAGAFWDLRQSLGLALATQLSHFAKYGAPDDPDDGVAMSEFFIETLLADDDDANLANGTPHLAAINAAFNAHGIGTAFWLSIAHAPLADQPGAGPYPVTATLGYSGPFGGLDPASPTLHFSIDGGAFVPAPMSDLGGGQFSAAVPAVGGAIVRYYLTAGDQHGGQSVHPAGALDDRRHLFLTGTIATVLTHDQETDQGWTVGDPGDAATTGVWLRAEPVGTSSGGVQVQPELDHTADPGTLCFVTGNGAPNDALGAADVDGGRTTLTSPVFSAAGISRPAIEYYRWYSNNSGADPGTDVWRVDLSNDGGASWTPVESTMSSDNSWRRVVFPIADLLPPTSTMRLRFVADDALPASLVEAAVDDFRMLSLPPTTGVGDPPAAATLSLAVPAPNPSADRTALRFVLARGGQVRLEIVDVAGRVVRGLIDGPSEPGQHVASWDGRDAGGRRAASGVYFARLVAEGRTLTRMLVRLR